MRRNSRARFLFCLAIALIAHALLLGWSAGERDTPAAANLLEATRAAGAAADAPRTSLRAIDNQRGDAERSQRGQAARAGQAGPASAAQTHRAGQRSLTRFVMVAERTPEPARQRAAQADTSAAPARTTRVRSAARDARAAYLANWQRRIEARGSRRYSRELLAADQPRRLTMAVRIVADGSLRGVRVLRTSGNPALDAAALAIVRAAAPYPPFDSQLAAADNELAFAYDWLFEPDRARSPESGN